MENIAVEPKRNVCAVERAGALDNKFRKLLHNPEKILGKYIEPGNFVMDFGCGPGFFSIEMAKLLQHSGKVIAVDLQQGMLDKLSNKIEGSIYEKSIQLHKCMANSIGLTESLDFILAFFVVHEVPNSENLFIQFNNMLKEKGKIFISEPLFHVPQRMFNANLEIALKQGFKVIETPKVFFSRSVVLEKI